MTDIQKRRNIELLAPAANADIAIEAILHGADAVYIGPPSHGARKSAGNSLDDIKKVVEFAHPFGVRVYATVNTIMYENECNAVARLISNLYKIGVDAVIVQDMGILRLDIPPIALHSSTQCDTRTPEKAKFLESVGFSQIVLARELTIEEIENICRSVSVPVECFIHGALCVSYSGRCHASQMCRGRSANRGECAQLCRLPYTLKDRSGKEILRRKHLLSLKDLNLSDRIEELLRVGVSSFKIEGRLKDATYVKNIVSHYRKIIDKIISKYPDKYVRSSYGSEEIIFDANPVKSFNRGFTHYFLDERRPANICSPLTPKSMGEPINDVATLNNGDGISYFNKNGEYEGVMVNGVQNGRILGNKNFELPKGETIHRTFDIKWQKLLSKPTSTRRLNLDVEINDKYVKGIDEAGRSAIVALPEGLTDAHNQIDLRNKFDKLGNTIYRLNGFDQTNLNSFIPPSQLSETRRRLINLLETTAKTTYKFELRRKEDMNSKYPQKHLDYQDNISNSYARQFYQDHGVSYIQEALEISKHEPNNCTTVMTTRHCILREMGKCLKINPNALDNYKLPLMLESGDIKFKLSFDCKNCEMKVQV